MLRQCRVAMVQTPSQYDFVHQAVVRFGKVNNKTIKVRDPDLPDGDTFSPSLDEVPEGETAVAIEPVKGLKYLDVGKRCTVRKYEGKEGCLMWMGKDPRKNDTDPDAADADDLAKAMKAKSCGLIPATNPLRKACIWLSGKKLFGNFILVLVMINCIILAFHTHDGPRSGNRPIQFRAFSL